LYGLFDEFDGFGVRRRNELAAVILGCQPRAAPAWMKRAVLQGEYKDFVCRAGQGNLWIG
jgi:hypothetical protein